MFADVVGPERFAEVAVQVMDHFLHSGIKSVVIRGREQGARGFLPGLRFAGCEQSGQQSGKGVHPGSGEFRHGVTEFPQMPRQISCSGGGEKRSCEQCSAAVPGDDRKNEFRHTSVTGRLERFPPFHRFFQRGFRMVTIAQHPHPFTALFYCFAEFAAVITLFMRKRRQPGTLSCFEYKMKSAELRQRIQSFDK